MLSRSTRWAALLLVLHSPFATAASGPVPVSVGPDVYALLGDNGEISSNNRGVVGNAGFIVGKSGVVVVDPGVSYRFGKEMLASIADVTPLPVTLVVITHPIQEFHFGSTAFQERGVPVIAHRKAADLMRLRCDTCLKNLRTSLGEEEMEGSKVVVPDRLIDDTTTLETGGRELQLIYFGWASTPGDLAMFDRRSGVLFAGGLISAGRIPLLRDADLEGWISALERLATLPAKAIIPGHGPVLTPAEAGQTLAYIRALKTKVRQIYKDGVGLSESAALARLPAFESWKLYEVVHRQNVQQLYLQLEREDLDRKER